MDYNAFLKQIDQSETPSGVYLFHGEEEFVKDSMLKRLEERCLEEATREMNYTVLDGAAATADAIIAAGETLPLMSPARLVVVKDYPGLKGGRGAEEASAQARLADYLKNISPTTCLVFFCRGKADSRLKLSQAIGKLNRTVEFKPLNEHDRVRWIQSQARRSGKQIAQNAAELLSFITGAGLEDLYQELQKLVAFAPGHEITARDVEQAATRNTAFTVFQMVDALAARQLPQAQAALEQMLHDGEAPVRILSMIARQFRLIRYAALLSRALPKGEAEKQLEAPPFAVRKAAGQAKNFTPAQVEHALKACADLDWQIKSGQIREDHLALQALVMDIHIFKE